MSVGYFNSTQVCCNGLVSSGNACCGNNGYYAGYQSCCVQNNTQVIVNGNSCCAGLGYFNTSQVCCQGLIKQGIFCYSLMNAKHYKALIIHIKCILN